MLSVESPPPDPSCPSDSSQLKDVSDERPSHELALPEVDLSKPPVLGETQLPKFSIRDYVFASRSKDIKINWPFSLKNLQLCFKHGVKDPLPPFQHFDAVKNQSLRKCLVDDKNISNNITEEPSEPEDDDYAALDSNHNTQLKEKLTETCVINSTTSWRCSEGDHNDFPSTVTSVSHFEIEESVPTNRPNSSVLLATTDTSLETSVEAEAAAAAAGPSVTHKLESTTRPSGKKCRLVVKFGAQTDRSSAEDIASNSTTVSETMASKICPVCKTFSSSSNTTLNAHIDQCLSVESTPKWTVDSKLTRHRIKPRKIRTMVDIYSTASHCTLEDLYRRNGSNCATISSFPTQDKEKRPMPVEEKKQRVPPMPSDNSTVDIGAVYIDENGTKVRILSKFDDVPSVSPSAPKVLECGRPSNPMKGGKGSKLFSTKNKKSHGVKYNKYLRPGRPSKKLFSSKGHSSQIFGDQARRYGEKETYEERGREKRVSPGNSVALRQWACSKRTGVAKKLGNSVSSQPSQCKWPGSQELQAVSDQSSLHTSLMRQSSEREFTKVSVSPISSPGNSVGTVSVSYGQQASDKGEQSPRKKRAGSPLSGPRIRGNVKRPLQLLKQNGRHLREESPSVVRDFQGPKTSDSTGIYKSLSRNKITGVASGLNAPSNFPSCFGKKLTRNYHASRSGAVKVSPSGKNIMSVGSKMVEPNSDGIAKCSSLKKSEVHLMEGVDEELVDRDFEDDESCDFMQNPAENQYSREDNSKEISVSRRTIGESRQNAEVLSTCKRKEVTTWDSSQVESQHHQNNEEKSSSVFLEQMDSVQPDCEGVRCSMDDIVAQPSYEAPFGENSELNSKLSHRSMIQSNSQHFNGALSRGEGPTEPNFFTGQGIFSSDDNILVQNVHTEEDLESGVGHGSSFPEVDPIPIPGPPGSFLPSPRDMGSEDFQGNSSLTTSRVQSSQDQQDCVDGDLSDSPVSAISMISNSAAPRYNAMYFKPTSLGHQLVEDKVRSSSRDGSFDSSVENTAQVPRSTSLATERLTFDGRDIAAVNNMPLSFENDNQPCCCQRKERASQGVTLNYQESQLLRRRTMASAMVPALNRHMGCNMSSGPDNLEGRSDIWPLTSCPTSKPANLPVLKFPASPNSLRGSPDAGVKFSVRSDCDSISPSTSNSILRLMGKNLMVGNRDEDEQGLSHPQTNRLSSQLATFSGATSSHIQNQVYHSYHPNFPHGSLISSQDLNNKVGKCFENTRLDNSSRSHPRLNVSQMFSEGPACLFPNLQRDGNLIGRAEPHEYKADYDIADPSDKPSMNMSSAASTRHVEKTPAFSDFKPKNVLCVTNNNKEMIIIDDDVPECEDKLNGDVKRYYGGLGESHVISSGVSFPAFGVNPFSYYQSQDCPPVSESPMVHNSNLHALTNSQKNASPHRWRRSSEGSGVLQQNSYLAAASPVGRMRYDLL